MAFSRDIMHCAGAFDRAVAWS